MRMHSHRYCSAGIAMLAARDVEAISSVPAPYDNKLGRERRSILGSGMTAPLDAAEGCAPKVDPGVEAAGLPTDGHFCFHIVQRDSHAGRQEAKASSRAASRAGVLPAGSGGAPAGGNGEIWKCGVFVRRQDQNILPFRWPNPAMERRGRQEGRSDHGLHDGAEAA